MRKRILSGLIFVSMLISLCGCTGTENSNSNKDTAEKTSATDTTQANNKKEKVKLTVWAEESAFDTTNKMIESFKKEYADEATFEIEIAQNLDSATKDNLLADIHNGADVFPLPDDQLISLVAAGILDEVPDSEKIKSANTPESVSAACINDIMYAYPMTADNGFFLYYDKDYFKEDDVKTLDKILQICEKNKKQFSMEFNSGWYMYAFFGNTGLEFGLNEDGVTNYCNWNATDTEIKGTDIAKSLLEITGNPSFQNRPDGEFPAAVQNGTAIAGISGVWNAIEIQKAWGEDYGACKLPTYTVAGKQVQMASFTGYKMMGVNHYSEHPEWANKLAAWLTNEENQTLRFVERNQGPSNINAAASDEVMKVPAIRAVIEQSEFGTLQRVGNRFWDATTSFGNIIIEGNPNNTSHQKLMDTLTEGITASVID